MPVWTKVVGIPGSSLELLGNFLKAPSHIPPPLNSSDVVHMGFPSEHLGLLGDSWEWRGRREDLRRRRRRRRRRTKTRLPRAPKNVPKEPQQGQRGLKEPQDVSKSISKVHIS